MIQLNEQQVKDLITFINKIPTEFGLPLIQFFGQLQAEQNPQTPQEEVKEN